MPGRRLLPALALAVLVAGCGGRGGTRAASSTSAPSTAASNSSTPSSTSSSTGGNGTTTTSPGSSTAPGTEHQDDGSASAPPFPADTRPDTQKPSAGAYGNVTDIRIGHHDGFDRVVFEFHGTGTPGWTVQYVPRALGQGSGLPIHVAGAAVLSVAITGVGYPPETGIQEFPTRTVSVAGTDVVTEVVFTGTFEGVSQAFVGTTAVRPFRVYLLTNPARIVLEVREH